MPAIALTQLDQGGRLQVLVDELVKATTAAEEAWSTSQSPSFSRRGWLAARDQAVDRFVKRVLEELPPPSDADPNLEGELRALAADLTRQKVRQAN